MVDQWKIFLIFPSSPTNAPKNSVEFSADKFRGKKNWEYLAPPLHRIQEDVELQIDQTRHDVPSRLARCTA